MCSGSDDSDADKLRKFQRMQQMHRLQTEETKNLINQSAGGFSLINIQWASFATGATAIIVCAMVFLAVLLCCWICSRNIRQSRDSSPRPRGASPAVHYRAQRAQSCQTSCPPSPRSRRNSVSAVAVESGVEAFEEVLVDVKVPRTGVYVDSA